MRGRCRPRSTPARCRAPARSPRWSTRSGCRTRCRVGGEGTAAIQVVDAQDRVRAASAGTDRLVPLLRPAEVAAGTGRAAAGRAPAPGSACPARCGWSGCRPARPATRRPCSSRSTSAAPGPGPGVLLVGLAVGRAAAARRGRAGDLVGRPAGRCGRWRSCAGAPRRSPGPARGCRCRRPGTRCHRLAVTLNDMLARLERPAPGSARSSPTPRTSCARRWPAPGPSWRWRPAVDAGTPAGELADGRAGGRRAARPAGRRPAAAGPAGRGAGAGRREPVDLDALAAEVVGRYAAARVPVRARPLRGRLHGAGRGRRGPAGAGQPGRQRGPARPVAGSGGRGGGGGHGDRDRRRAGHPGRRPGAGLRPVHPARLRTAAGTRAAPGSGWPSSASWSLRTAARSRSATPAPAWSSPSISRTRRRTRPAPVRRTQRPPPDRACTRRPAGGGFAASGLPNQDYLGKWEGGGRGEASPALWWGLRRRGGIGTGGLKHRAQPPRSRCPRTSVSPVRPLPDSDRGQKQSGLTVCRAVREAAARDRTAPARRQQQRSRSTQLPAAGGRRRVPGRARLGRHHDDAGRRAGRRLPRRPAAPLPDQVGAARRRGRAPGRAAQRRAAGGGRRAAPGRRPGRAGPSDLLASLFTGPLFAAAIEVWVAARTDPALRTALVPVEARFGREVHRLTVAAARRGRVPARGPRVGAGHARPACAGSGWPACSPTTRPGAPGCSPTGATQLWRRVVAR